MNSWQVSLPASLPGIHRANKDRTTCVYTSSAGFQVSPITFAIQPHMSCGIQNQPLADWNVPFDDFCPDVFLKDFENVDTSEYNKVQPVDISTMLYPAHYMTSIKPSRHTLSPAAPVSIFSSRFGCPAPSPRETGTFPPAHRFGPGYLDLAWEKPHGLERKHVHGFQNDVIAFPMDRDGLGAVETMLLPVLPNGEGGVSSAAGTRNRRVTSQPLDCNGGISVMFRHDQIPKRLNSRASVVTLQSGEHHSSELQNQEDSELGLSSSSTLSYGTQYEKIYTMDGIKQEKLDDTFGKQEINSVERFLRTDVPFAPISDMYETARIKAQSPPLSEVQTNNYVNTNVEEYQIDSIPEIGNLFSHFANKHESGSSSKDDESDCTVDSSTATQETEWPQISVTPWKYSGEMGFLEVEKRSPRVSTRRSITSSIDVTTDICKYGRADNEPRRPKNGFIRFSIENRHKIAADHPKLDNRDISKVLGCKWRKMNVEEKKQYEIEFHKDIKTIRAKNPQWCYAPSKKLAEIEPMPSRLRPRHSLKRVPVDMLPQRRHSVKSKKKKTKLDIVGPTTWLQCNLCSKWRCLPRYILPENQSKAFCCTCREDNHETYSCCEKQKREEHSSTSVSSLVEKEVHMPIPCSTTLKNHTRIPWSNSRPLTSASFTHSDSNAHVLLREPSW